MKKERTKDKQERNGKDGIIKWLVVLVLFIQIMIVIITIFSVKSSKEAKENVQQRVIQTVEEYASEIAVELNRMAEPGKTVLYYMNQYGDEDEVSLAKVAEALCVSTSAYEIACVNADNQALMCSGEWVDIEGLSYYSQIMEASQKLLEKTEDTGATEPETSASKATETIETAYLYVEDEELGKGKRAIIVMLLDTAEREKKLLMYYPIEELQVFLDAKRLTGEEFCMLADADGEIIEVEGLDHGFHTGGNIWNSLKEAGAAEEEIAKAIVRMKNGVDGTFQIEASSMHRTLVYADMGINHWVILMEVSQSYIDAASTTGWRNSMEMIHQMAFIIFVFTVIICVMITRSKIMASKRNRALEVKADTDLLTGLNNKAATERKIEEYMERHPDEQALMFILDIDNFKKINDTMGHAFGDEVLKSLGMQVGSMFRATDVIGRMGGDEFIIFLKYLKEDELLEKEARKLCDFFQGFQVGEYVKYSPTSSIGAAIFPRDGQDFNALYKSADAALYTAKERGKNQIAFYKDTIPGIQGGTKVEKYR